MKPEDKPAQAPSLPETGGTSAPSSKRPIAIGIGTVVLAVALWWVGGWALDSWTHEETDDAFLDAHVVSIAPKVGGIVNTVHIKQNQTVRKGDPLLEIDPRDFETKLAQKKAARAAAEANAKTVRSSFELIKARVTTAETSVKQVAAEVAFAEAANEKAQSDLKRNEDLQQRKVISPQEFENVKTAASSAAANLRAAREKLAGEESKVREAKAQLEAALSVIDVSGAQLNSAQADVAAAELDVSYAHLVSPIDGRITNKRVEPGDYVQVGQALFALVPNELWVAANFKETQLRKIRTNQPVEIEIDSVADRKFRGHVESVQSGSGARFSLLPPENAVGNFVKVVQRVPVKIVFDESIDIGQVLGPGMSVQPAVRISDFHVSNAVIWLVAIVLAIVIGAIVWRLTDPRRKG
jgi:membrane fusion protein (multidrug efflux system)